MKELEGTIEVSVANQENGLDEAMGDGLILGLLGRPCIVICTLTINKLGWISRRYRQGEI